MPRTFFKLGIVLVCVMSACGEPPSEAIPEPPAATPSAEAVAPPRTANKRRIGNVDGTTKHLWWNQEEIARDLALRPEQKAQMDIALREYLNGFRAAQDRRNELGSEFAEAVKSGDLDAARRAIEEGKEVEGMIQTSYPQMALRVIEQLDEAQYAAMRERYGHLLGRRWIRQVPFGGASRDE